MNSTPRSSAAVSMPMSADWLNDLSLNPPSSDTRQGLKPSTATGPSDSELVGVDSGAEPQPARATRRPAAATTPTSFLVREMVNSASTCIAPSPSRGLHKVTHCDAMLAVLAGGRCRMVTKTQSVDTSG